MGRSIQLAKLVLPGKVWVLQVCEVAGEISRDTAAAMRRREDVNWIEEAMIGRW